MKRGYLFVTALVTAIITFAGLSAIFGRTSFRHYGYHHGYCNYYDDHHERNMHKPADTTAHY